MTTDESILVRLDRAEKDIEKVQAQLNLYVPMTVSDLKINSILEATNRISAELESVKEAYRLLAERLTEQQMSASRLQVNVLKATMGTFVSVAVAIFVGYITHFFH